jgi:hypothetical protein
VERSRESLLSGRRITSLTPEEIKSMERNFRGLGYDGPLEFDESASSKTKFVVARDENDDEFGKIIVGADIFPGYDVANPNAVLDPIAAVAHEITHYTRWVSKRELPFGIFNDIDEAMTSLQAVCAFKSDLNALHIEQLVSDALSRLVKYQRNFKLSEEI